MLKKYYDALPYTLTDSDILYNIRKYNYNLQYSALRYYDTIYSDWDWMMRGLASGSDECYSVGT